MRLGDENRESMRLSGGVVAALLNHRPILCEPSRLRRVPAITQLGLRMRYE